MIYDVDSVITKDSRVNDQIKVELLIHEIPLLSRGLKNPVSTPFIKDILRKMTHLYNYILRTSYIVAPKC